MATRDPPPEAHSFRLQRVPPGFFAATLPSATRLSALLPSFDFPPRWRSTKSALAGGEPRVLELPPSALPERRAGGACGHRRRPLNATPALRTMNPAPAAGKLHRGAPTPSAPAAERLQRSAPRSPRAARSVSVRIRAPPPPPRSAPPCEAARRVAAGQAAERSDAEASPHGPFVALQHRRLRAPPRAPPRPPGALVAPSSSPAHSPPPPPSVVLGPSRRARPANCSNARPVLGGAEPPPSARLGAPAGRPVAPQAHRRRAPPTLADGAEPRRRHRG